VKSSGVGALVATMDFVSLIGPGGVLWKAWVAAHWDRRLKRHDYMTADVKATTGLVLERLRETPLRCVGHIMLGICRILRWQASALEEEADEVRNALLTSLASGPGLAKVAAVSASAVTLRHQTGEAPSLDLGVGAGSLDMLMEPELPALEVEASLQEGRRHVAPLELITLSPGTPRRPPELPSFRDSEGFGEGFGAASAEDYAAMAAVGEAALQLPAGNSPASPDKGATDEEPPALDFLLGASPGAPGAPDFDGGSLDCGGDVVMGGLDDDAAMAAIAADAADVASMELPPSAEDVDDAAEERTGGETAEEKEEDQELALVQGEAVTPTSKRVVRALEFDTPKLPPPENRGPGPRQNLLARLMELSPPRPDAPPRNGAGLVAVDEQPMLPAKKRRRKQVQWLDEQTVISERAYHDTGSITRATPLEYGIFLPHRNHQVGLTTTLSDLCPMLCEPLQRAAVIGEKRRRARAEEAAAMAAAATSQGPNPGSAAASTSSRSPAARAEPEDVTPSRSSRPRAQEPEDGAAATDAEDSSLQLLLASPGLPSPTRKRGAASPEGEATDADAERPEEDLGTEAEEGTGEDRSQRYEEPDAMDVDAEFGGGSSPLPPAPASPPASVARGEEGLQVVSCPPLAAERVPEAPRAVQQGDSGGSFRPDLRRVQVKLEAEENLDSVAVSAEQARQLREALAPEGEAASVSFLGLCDTTSLSCAEAARRFVDLLALHMEGAVSLDQEEPYGDISVGKGPDWHAWKEAGLRGPGVSANVEAPAAAV